jgi:adenylate cyclase
MADEGFKRKLTAVLSADAVEYSRLMAEDETSTVKTIATYREIISSLIKQHRGRVVDSPGDNLLAEFSSVVDAVQCAVAVQNEIQTRNAELAENRRMEFRIGVNLGDVIDEDDRIYGDGVNIAARLESLADPGGICVSKTAFDQIETKLPLGYEYIGEQRVKNIPKPVGAYRVLMKPEAVGKVIGEKRFLGRFSRRAALAAIIILFIAAGGLVGWNIYLQQSKKVKAASEGKTEYPLLDKPSIAVLPFVNMSGDSGQEYFSDGITEQIITALSKTPKLFVIARNSTFTYKGKAVKVQQVGRELGVKYVLEGSVRKAKDTVRITAQLIDAQTGSHLWADQYDRKLKDIFAIQDEITLQINTALQVELTKGDQARMRARGTDNLEAYLKASQGLEYFFRFNSDDNIKARQLAQEAIALDPNYAYGYSLLGWTYMNDVMFHWTKSPKEYLKKALELGQKALALDEGQETAHRLVGTVYLVKRQPGKAIGEFERAVAVAPSSSFAHAGMGQILIEMGRPEEAVTALEKAVRLNPFPPIWFLTVLGRAYFFAGNYGEAIKVYQKCLHIAPTGMKARAELAAAYALSGRKEEAHNITAEILKINPRFTVEDFLHGIWSRNQDLKNLLADGLRKAGLE